MTPDQLKAVADSARDNFNWQGVVNKLRTAPYAHKLGFLAGAELMRAENELLKKRVEVLEGACRSGVGYEPMPHTLEPRKFSEALTESSRIAKGEV